MKQVECGQARINLRQTKIDRITRKREAFGDAIRRILLRLPIWGDGVRDGVDLGVLIRSWSPERAREGKLVKRWDLVTRQLDRLRVAQEDEGISISASESTIAGLVSVMFARYVRDPRFIRALQRADKGLLHTRVASEVTTALSASSVTSEDATEADLVASQSGHAV